MDFSLSVLRKGGQIQSVSGCGGFDQVLHAGSFVRYREFGQNYTGTSAQRGRKPHKGYSPLLRGRNRRTKLRSMIFLKTKTTRVVFFIVLIDLIFFKDVA